MTTKILALTDALGNLLHFVLMPGQRFDAIGVPPLIPHEARQFTSNRGANDGCFFSSREKRPLSRVTPRRTRRRRPNLPPKQWIAGHWLCSAKNDRPQKAPDFDPKLQGARVPALRVRPPRAAKALQSPVISPDRFEMRPACPALS